MASSNKVELIVGKISLKNKTILITGASRGIGLAIALRAAKDGANIIIAAKTTEPHPKLPGTIYTAAKLIEEAGGKALPVVCDIRSDEQVEAAVAKGVNHFGGLDILVNNASAIWVRNTLETPMKRFDLMHGINSRGTYTVSRACIPHLLDAAKAGRNPHILNISPPPDLHPKWFAPCVAYTVAKYNMTLFALGMAEEFREQGIAVNTLWPRTAIATAAVEWIFSPENLKGSRKPEIMADAAYTIITQPTSCTGNFFVDDDVLKKIGVTNFTQYAVDPSQPLILDFFVEPDPSINSGGMLVVAKL